MSNQGTRGKWAEGKLRDEFKKLETKASFTYHRFADARAGFRQDAPADFMLLQAGRPTLLECKEVDHSHLLPYKNFESEQVARMRLWEAAGARSLVVVACKKAAENHRMKSARVWRLVPLEAFLERPTTPKYGQIRAVGSWDLTSFPLLTLAEVVSSLTN